MKDFMDKNGITKRSQWSTDMLDRSNMEYDWDYNTIVIHHSGDWGEKNPHKILEMHIERNKYDDMGYHFIIKQDGEVLEGRSLVYKGSHVKNANTAKIGILVMGDFQWQWWDDDDEIRANQKTSLETLILQLKNFFPTIRILGGHRDFIVDQSDPKRDCPGDELYKLLPGLRQRTSLSAP